MRDLLPRDSHRAVSLMLLIALVFTAAMAIISNTTYRIHPDELDHVAAGRFYKENWIPPAVGDPNTLDSYSYAGSSYLNEWDIVYLLAGKFAFLLQPVVQNETYAFRLFNVGLFLLLACVAWARRDAILLFATLLLSAQIWYLFSYFNADAFAMCVSFLAAYQLVSPQSAFNERSRSVISRYVPIAICVGLIILSKRTFWIFGVYALCHVALTEYWHGKKHGWLRNMTILAVMICAIALPRIGYDVYVNGVPSEKTAKLIATAELLADKEFKPSQLGASAYSQGMKLREQGWGVLGMLRWKDWVEMSITTAFGTYRYLSLRGPTWSYVLSAGCVALLAGGLFVVVITKGNPEDKVFLALSVACCLAIVGLSIYHSWTIDFQPQGRYLFAIAPILGVMLTRTRDLFRPALINSLIAIGFVLSACSFVFVGLQYIPKYWEQVTNSDHPALRLEREWKRSGGN